MWKALKHLWKLPLESAVTKMGGYDRGRGSDAPEVRLLGELQVLRSGRARALPPSRKTRALLAYLVATGEPHRRERLCDLLWDGPDDPRAELRWSLSKIRPLLDSAEFVRLRTDRERVLFEPAGSDIDLLRLYALLGSDPRRAPIAAVSEAVGLFRGEFLDGLDLPGCYRFQAWCLAERDTLSTVRLVALETLIERLDEQPDQALAHARALIAADPLSATGHAAVVRLLGKLGRRREALAQYERASHVLQAELGVRASDVLEQARRSLSPAPSFRSAATYVADPGPSSTSPRAPHCAEAPIHSLSGPERRNEAGARQVPLVGRETECGVMGALVTDAVAARSWRVLVLLGEPGIGKSRLLRQLSEQATAAAGRVLSGRGFEAEAARPYGPWTDALRSIASDEVPPGLRPDLALLQPAFGPAPAETPADRSRLFDAVAGSLRHLAGRHPTVLLLDDLQWFDDASAALLHYVLRSFPARTPLLFACAARSGEIEDNPPISQLLQALARDQRRLDISLGPLSEGETAELVQAIDPALDAGRIFAESEGSPLLALELARSLGREEGAPAPSLEAMIASQLSRLSPRARDLLVWAAALGRSFEPDLLGRTADTSAPMLASALEELERRGILRAVGADNYDFTHDLVRQAVYQTISQPRRRLVHRHIAHVLSASLDSEPTSAGALARHATQGGNDALAVHACRIAGERCIRVFANAEAVGFADRGLLHLDRLPDGPDPREARIDLLRLKLLAGGPRLRRSPQLGAAVARATAAAEQAGLAAAAAIGHYLLSVVHQEAGDTDRARDSTFRAAEAGRAAGDRAVRARQLANTARCLVDLETEVQHARELSAEAEQLAEPLGLEFCDLRWVRGLLARWEGVLDEATPPIRHALDLARYEQDRRREHWCLTSLAVTEFERKRFPAVLALCRELSEVGTKLGHEEIAFSGVLEALAEFSMGIADAEARLARALDQMRVVDDKAGLAYALNAASSIYLRSGRHKEAGDCAWQALTAARAVRRESDEAIARALLVRSDPARAPEAAQEMAELINLAGQPDRVGARARTAVIEAATACGMPIPTLVPM